jgi:hypothetical protein
MACIIVCGFGNRAEPMSKRDENVFPERVKSVMVQSKDLIRARQSLERSAEIISATFLRRIRNLNSRPLIDSEVKTLTAHFDKIHFGYGNCRQHDWGAFSDALFLMISITRATVEQLVIGEGAEHQHYA